MQATSRIVRNFVSHSSKSISKLKIPEIKGASSNWRHFQSSATLNQGLGEPTDPEVPLYDALNVQVKGYDFAVLEKFARYVHHTAERVGLEVEDSWATPCKNLRVTKLKPESAVVDSEYLLNLFERNVQIVEVPATLLPVFINIVEASIPAGVTLRVHPHLPEHTENRYVPDLELMELKTQLQDIKEKK
ncbi:39S ribosomal protein L48, mitochondrial [Orchesella cincta]|uniref:39S ribosomal protein L48, mitochondrial n=1 Tax=Orchesella cincta TaxID=48709 RepID=A0A1D2N342_ORCCI|nr:39S ribosomal protein L48, mitochondrial [Orchesella cincta]